MVRVAIVDDTRLCREGLAHILMREEHVSVAGTAGRLDESLALVRNLRPDVVLLRMSVPESITLLRGIIDEIPDMRIVALGVSETEEEIIACAEGGAAGFFPRDGSLDDLVALVQSVARGELPCSPRIAAALFRRVASLAAERQSQVARVRLTPREWEILQLIDVGLSNKDISQRLSVEVRTVKSHVHNILEKLKVHRRGEAAARMRQVRPEPTTRALSCATRD